MAIIDGDASGPDNRGVDPAPGTYSAVTDDNGEARVTITVSMQPGNNYRAGASVLQDALGQATQQTADDQSIKSPFPGNREGYSVPLVWSRMLTVWRKLHVETDSMAAPDPADLRVVGSIGAVFPTPARPSLTTVKFGNPPNASIDLNNYEEGTIIFSNCPTDADTFPVVESYPGNDMKGIPHELIVLGTPGACAAVGTGYTLYDDDDLSGLGTPSSPRFPSGGSLLTSAFEPAYILPVYAGAQYQDVVAFDEYVTASQVYTGIGSWNNGHDLSSTNDFWSCLVVGAWEGSDDLSELSRDGDGDPDECFNLFMPPEAREGAETPLTGVRRPETQQCIAFLQAIADDASCVDQTDEAHTVVHEIGHTSGDLPHKDGTIMEQGAPKNQNSFYAEQLNILRNQDSW